MIWWIRLRSQHVIAIAVAAALATCGASAGAAHAGARIRSAGTVTRCPGSVAGCQRALLALLNQDRARYHVGPLLLDEVQSDGTRRCIGALGHSRHMAAQGQISHDDFPSDICGPHQLAGENVGVAQGWSEFFSLHRLDRMMMAEGSPRPGCTGTHACNIINPGFRTVGIGIVKIGSAFWLTEDFKG